MLFFLTVVAAFPVLVAIASNELAAAELSTLPIFKLFFIFVAWLFVFCAVLSIAFVRPNAF